MKRHWTPHALSEYGTITPAERPIIQAQKGEHTRLGLAVLLKYTHYEGRFPRTRYEVPPAIIVHLANQRSIAADAIIRYDWESRTATVHRQLVRCRLNLRPATLQDSRDLSAF